MKNPKPIHLLALLGLATLTVHASAQSWPDRPITMIVPFPPGIVDANARLIAAKASTLLGQTIVVKNQPGAGQRIGTEALSKAQKDGYTIGVVTNAGVVSSPALGARVNYDAVADFSYIAMGFESHYLINTHPGTGIRSLAELVNRAKADPEKVRFGSTGIGTGFHVATEQFLQTAGMKIQHIPYNGESPLLTNLAGGQVEMAFSSLGSRKLAEAGKLTMLAYTGETRSKLLPNVPTAKEQGVSHVSSGWLGFAAPAGIPQDVRLKLIQAFEAAARDPEIVTKFEGMGLESRSLSGDAFSARVRSEIDSLRELNKTLKISLE
ncbi:MAG: Bug family tripartite tricarboxylate transporter substrate binding protein [Rubrivivax sp.]|jgi:tripartite-type tricarboxylate transporter receptor subunit TctC